MSHSRGTVLAERAVVAQTLAGVDQAGLHRGRGAVGDMVSGVVAAGPVDAVETLIASTLDPPLDCSAADVEARGDAALGVAAAHGSDDITAACEVGLFALIWSRSGEGTVG